MLKRIQTAICLGVAISAFTATSAHANEWFEQQRSISDGSAYSNHESTPAGALGRSGHANDYEASAWLNLQLTMSDGYSQPGAEAESAFVGASIELHPNQRFAEQGRHISDGATE